MIKGESVSGRVLVMRHSHTKMHEFTYGEQEQVYDGSSSVCVATVSASSSP